MGYYVKSVVPVIESNYDKFTTVEKTIADFFIQNKEKSDFSVKAVSERLFVSKASLVRFAQKCGYHGYKEFIYQYEDSLIEKQESITGNTRMVLNAYQELLNKTYEAGYQDGQKEPKMQLYATHTKNFDTVPKV